MGARAPTSKSASPNEAAAVVGLRCSLCGPVKGIADSHEPGVSAFWSMRTPPRLRAVFSGAHALLLSMTGRYTRLLIDLKLPIFIPIYCIFIFSIFAMRNDAKMGGDTTQEGAGDLKIYVMPVFGGTI